MDKAIYNNREKVAIDISVKDKKGNPVRANLSVSVKNKTSIINTDNNNKNNIISSIFLQADVKGNIENPRYYFSNVDNAKKDLDILLLTQAWRKFNWDNILQDTIPKPKFQIEKDISISGRMTKYLFDISAKNATVQLTFLNKFNDVFKTVCDKKGRFSFNGLDYNDTLDVLLEFRSQVGRKNIMVILDESEDIGVNFKPFTGFYLDSLQIKHRIAYKKPQEEIDENKPKDFKIYNEADQVIKFDDPHYSTYTNVMDAIQGKVPGLTVGQNGARLRGINTLFGNTQPLYLVDGMATSFQGIQSINVNDIDRVEILKGPSSAIFGSRGANGVIAVYTKSGSYYKRGEYRFKMLGYHTPKKFYSPKYSVKKTDDKPDKRTTIYWKPIAKTDINGNARIEYFQSDVNGKFEIIIEGMSSNGKLGSYTKTYKTLH